MMQERRAITSVSINDLAARRWSPRAFDAARGVTPAQLSALLEAARRHGVRRVVFASTHHVIGYYRRGRPVGPDDHAV